jgi:subtilase family serine protease
MKKDARKWPVLFLALLLALPWLALAPPAESNGDGNHQTCPRAGTGFPGGRSSSRSAGEPDHPDIVLANLSWSLAGSYDGAGGSILATVFNDGLSTSSPFPVELYADGAAVGSAVVNGLTTGSSTTVKASWTASAGAHEFRAVADPGDIISESNETNNFKIAYLEVPFPDLVIANVSWYPQDFREGDRVTVAAMVSNMGQAGTTRQFVLESFIDQTRQTNRIIGGLGAAGSALAAFQWTASAGNHTLYMTVDPGNAVLESNEMNNKYVAHIGQNFSDILPINVSVSPGEPVDGEPAVLAATVKNAGKGGVTEQFKVAFIIDGETVGTAVVWGLASNASAPVSVSWKASGGHHDLRVLADYEAVVEESIESNNYRVMSFDVPWPDLVVKEVRWDPAVPTDGRQVSFNITVLNRGNGSTARQFAVGLMVDGVSISTPGVLGLQKGLQKNVTAIWTAVPGSHEFRAMADASRGVYELDETNNVFVDSVDVPYPDIIVSALDYAPKHPDPKTPVTLSASVQNAGPGNTSRYFEVKFFAAGNEVGTISLNGLNAGSPRNLSVSWDAEPGISELEVVADTGDTIMELSELNNSASVEIDVPYPDIAVEGMHWTPGNFTAGQPLNVSADLHNIGTGNQTGYFSVQLFSDSGLVAARQVAGLRSGENYSVNFSFIPLTAPATLRVEADPQAIVKELSETNNNLTLFFPNRTAVAPPPSLDIAIIGLRSFPDRPVDGDNVAVVASIGAYNLTSGSPLDIEMLLLVDARQSASVKTTILAEEGLATFGWMALPGAHVLQVVADPQGLRSEAAEDNNLGSLRLTVSPPDIVITSLSPSSPNATDGEGASIFCGLANTGQGDTKKEIVTSFFVDGELVQTTRQAGLPAGQTNSMTFSFQATPGTHRLSARTNAGRSILETSVLNDNAISLMEVGRPDIVVTAIDAAAAAEEGAPVTITAVIANNGGGTTREIQVAIFIDAIQIGRMTVSSLLAGRSAPVSRQWTAIPGSHLVTVAADMASAVGESDETNNWLSVRGIDVASSDIQVLELSIDGPPVMGANRLVSARVQNAGEATSRDMEIGFCLDERLQKTVRLGGLPANSSYVVPQTIPVEPGLHTLKVTADVLDSVQELDETNNDAVLDIDMPEAPDLTLAGLRVPATAADGEDVHIFAEVENSGTANFIDRFVVTLYVDGLIVAEVLVEGLPAGGSTTVSARWTASPGTHFFRAMADLPNSIAETNETDNEMHREGASVEQPDLIVRDVSTVKGPGQEGTDEFMVFSIVENIGGATFRPIHVAALADASPLGNIELCGLPARTATQVSFPVRSLNPHRITVVADYDDSIQEHDDFDNEAGADFAPLFEVLGARPDLTVSEISAPSAQLTDGQPTIVFVTVDNSGNASLTFGVDVQLSWTGGARSQTKLHGLLAGESAVIGFPWTVLGGITTFNATVNSGRTQPEWSYEDNQLERELNLSLPDYKIASLMRWNSTEGLGDTMYVVVDNAGIGDTVRTTTLDMFIGGVLYAQEGFNGLRAGEEMTVPIHIAAVSGPSDIRVEVDRQEQTQESDEGNNVYFDESYARYPELSLANISWAPHLDNGSILTIFADVQNTGTGATGRPVQVSFSVDSERLGTNTVNGLPSNSTTVLTWKWTVQPGEHVFSAMVDLNDAVREPNENDNRLVVDFPSGRTGQPPQFSNIRLDNVTCRQSRNQTGNHTQNIVTVVISVQNDGQQNLTGSFAALFADSLLAAELPIPPMAVNSTAVVAYPWNATIANHTVKVIVDYRRQFPEDIETDNDLAMELEQNNPPFVNPVGNYSVTAGDPVTLRGGGNDVKDGFIALYEWDLNGDGTYEYNSTVSGTVTHVYHTNGTYIVRLRVTDDRGATAISTGIVFVKLRQERPLLRADEVTFVAIILCFAVLAGAAVMIYRKRDGE